MRLVPVRSPELAARTGATAYLPEGAAMSDAVTPVERAPIVGVYRFWRDTGSVVGGLIAGAVADALGYGCVIACVAALTASSGLWVLADMPAARAPRRRPPLAPSTAARTPASRDAR